MLVPDEMIEHADRQGYQLVAEWARIKGLEEALNAIARDPKITALQGQQQWFHAAINEVHRAIRERIEF